jgi:hypothetical protein
MSALSARLTWLWRRPAVGIAFSPHMLLALRAENGARAIRRDIPPGLLVPSAVAPNIHSVREVAQLASGMVDELSGRGATAAVLLPDLSVVNAVFPALPGAVERDLGSKLASRFGVPAPEARSDSWKGGKGEVLGAAVREAVVRQYEQVIEAAECRPGWIDAASLVRIPSWAEASESEPGTTVVQALLYRDHYALTIFREGELIDVRIRLRSGDDVDAVAAEIRRLRVLYEVPALGAVALSGEGASDCARLLSESRVDARLSWEDGGEEGSSKRRSRHSKAKLKSIAMKQGINLGRPPARSNLLLTAMLVAAGGGTLVLAVLYQVARTEVEALADEVASLSESLEESQPTPSPDRARFVAARLRLALDSAAPESVPPTSLLRLVESVLPEGVLLERLSFDASPRRSLTLEASALGGDRVTELQRRLSVSPSVSTTSLLEERRLPDGWLAVRIQVDLEPK